MASVRCTDVQSRPTECLDFPSLPHEEFQRERSQGPVNHVRRHAVLVF